MSSNQRSNDQRSNDAPTLSFGNRHLSFSSGVILGDFRACMGTSRQKQLRIEEKTYQLLPRWKQPKPLYLKHWRGSLNWSAKCSFKTGDLRACAGISNMFLLTAQLHRGMHNSTYSFEVLSWPRDYRAPFLEQASIHPPNATNQTWPNKRIHQRTLPKSDDNVPHPQHLTRPSSFANEFRVV